MKTFVLDNWGVLVSALAILVMAAIILIVFAAAQLPPPHALPRSIPNATAAP